MNPRDPFAAANPSLHRRTTITRSRPMSTILLLRRIASPLLALAGARRCLRIDRHRGLRRTRHRQLRKLRRRSFPSPAWSDFGSFFPTPPGNPDPVLPSMTSSSPPPTPFGHATQALQNVDVVATSKGVYAPLDGGSLLSVSADVRTLRYSGLEPRARDALGRPGRERRHVHREPAVAPFLSIYASSSTKGWRLGYSGAMPRPRPTWTTTTSAPPPSKAAGTASNSTSTGRPAPSIR